MKPLAQNEKTLLLILCAAIFVALNMLGLRAFLQARSKLQQAIVAAKSELATDINWVNVAETLQPARSWIESHPMPQSQPDDASAALLKLEQSEAEKADLKVTEENLLPQRDIPNGSSVGVAVKLSGPFAGIVRFLYAMQTPTAWRTIDKLTLRSDAQPPNVIADIELRQYFHPGAPPSAQTQTSPP
jgi:hypothetical protein